jgi:hypothetical protein
MELHDPEITGAQRGIPVASRRKRTSTIEAIRFQGIGGQAPAVGRSFSRRGDPGLQIWAETPRLLSACHVHISG